MVKRLGIISLSLLLCGLAMAQSVILTRRRGPNATLVPNNCDSVNDSSLKAYWKLDEVSGNATDAKGANTLTDNNFVGTSAGQIGASRDFSAAFNRYLSSSDNAALSAGDIDFTVGAWVRFGGGLVPGAYPTILSKWVSGATKEYVLYLNGDNNRFEFSVSGDGTAVTTVTANNFGDASVTAWHHVIAWHNATANTINITVDGGTADSAAHTTGIFDSNSEFEIGAFEAGFFWTGQIDEAFITKRLLTAGERTSLYNGSGGCRPSGL